MSPSVGLLAWRKSFRYRVVACFAVDLMVKAAFAPAVAASTAPGSGANGLPPAHDAAPAAGTAPDRAASTTATGRPTKESLAGSSDSVPELWTPRAAAVVDASPPLGADSLFDGDATTGLTAGAGTSAAVRLDLGSAQDVLGLGVRGNGRAKIAIYAEDAGGARTPIGAGHDAGIMLDADHWAQLAPEHPTRTAALVVQWTATPGAPASLTELALWVGGRSQQALSEAAIADRLVTELPENATAATAVPWTASVARVARDGGSVSAKFDLKLNGDPLLGRAFLVYDVEKKAHWTGVARSINGHVVRGGYRAEAQGLGGVQVEEINPAWLRSGDNVVLFQPTLREDGRGYSIHNVRIVSFPRGSDPVPAPGARTSLSDGDLGTGVGGPGAHTASLSVRADREPAFLSFYLDKPTGGTLTVAGDGGWSNRKGQVNVELDGRPAGWQTVPVAGVLPTTTGELKVRVRGDKESTGQVGEVRVHWFPALTSQAGITMSYPLHGECHDHKTYVRGFAAGTGRLQKPLLSIDGAPVLEKIDADGSFEADVQEPAAAKGKPWSIRLDVATGDGGHRTRTVPVDSCVETPKGRIIGMSPPVEDVGAPYGAVVSPQKASTLSFAGATLDIPAGAVDSDVRVTMRALDRGQVSPVQSEMDNVTTGGGALRFGPHGLKFNKPIKVTLPIDAARMPAGMNEADVVAFFFDEASAKWTELPKVLGRPDRVVAETTHFTDFIASTIKMPDHPDGQKFDPNTMKGVKVGEPGAGITLIQPPEANSSGSARLSYPIETPPGRNGIGPTLALKYDSDHVNTNGWLGLGWDLRMSSIEIDTRFGVPKYDATDIYSLDGAMLTPTAAPSGAPSGGQYFGRRVEGAFDWIQRVGTDPTRYSWTVTDKKGTVYTYGTVANSRLANPRTQQPPANTFMAAPGSIFRWYLERVQDTYGNFMTITYQHDASVLGTSPNTESGDEVYLSAIDYTANANTSLAANYHVTFTLDAVGTRPDNTITARSGFVVATRQRLTDITVKSGTTVVRQYHFDYQQNLTDTMQKSVLADVALWGPTGQSSELYRHTFEYAKAPAATAMFTGQQTWGQVAQASTGLNHSSDNLIGGAVSLGVGFPDFSATGSLGMDYGNSTPDLAFLGITGEGLPDQIDINGLMSQNALTGVPLGQHFAPTQLSQFNTGLGVTDRSGWTAGGSISAFSAFGVGASYGRHLSNDRSVITDMNGDGFPDVVRANGGEVDAYLNNGQRGFSGQYQPWSNYDLSDAPFSTATRVSQAGVSQAFFKTDPLMRWVAPFGGTVTVNSTAVKKSPTGDDLRVELYIVNDPVRSVTIPANDNQNAYTLASNVSHTVAAGDKIFMRLVALNGGVSDGAQLRTTIVYTPPGGRSASEVDPRGFSIFWYGNEDGIAAGQPNVPWHLTGDGDIAVARCFYKGATSDDVKVSYVFRDKNGQLDPRMPTLAWTFAAAASAPNNPQTSPLCVGSSVLPPVGSDWSMSIIHGVKADDNVSLEITSDSGGSGGVEANPMSNGYTMSYTDYYRNGVHGAPQKTGSGYTIPGDPYANFTIPGKDITYGSLGDTFTAPYYQTTVQRIYNSGTTATTNPIRFLAAPSTSVTFGGSVRTSTTLTEDVLVLIQGVNKLHAKVKIPKGTAAGRTFSVSAPACTVTSDCEAGRTCSSGQCTGPATVTSGEPIFFTIESPTVIGGNVSWSPTVNGTAVSSLIINSAIQDPTYDNNAPVANTTRDPMSGGLHRWFYGDWNDNIAFVDANGHPGGAIVRTSAIPLNKDAVMPMIPCELTQLLPWDDDFQYFHFPRWQGRGGSQITQDWVIPGRVNDTSATATSGSGMSALRVADTWNVDVNVSVTPMTAGGNGGDATTQVDFFDVNGDRFPDSITRDGVQYNDGVGSFSPRQASNNMMFSDSSDLRSILNVGLQAGVAVGGGANRQLENEAEGDGSTKKISATVSLQGSGDYGVNSTRVDFVDVNGDGLVDHVEENPSDGRLRVKLNLGYGFSNEVPWTAPGWGQDHTVVGWPSIPGSSGTTDPVGYVLNKFPGSPNNTNVVRLQDTGTLSATVGGNIGDTIGGGGGPTWSVTRKWVDLIDVNGDGLPDQVMKIPGDTTLHVKLNQGDRFSADQNWRLPSWAPPGGFDANFSFMSQDTLEFSTINGWTKNVNVQVCVILCFGMSGYESDSQGGASATFEDIDGDGKVDQVMKLPGDANVYAKLSNIGPTNLLVAVNRPFGGRFTIDYTRVGNYVDLSSTPKVNMPANQWAMDNVVLDSGNGQSWNAEIFEQFDYTNTDGHYSGYFDPVERENLGYANVKTVFPNEDTGRTSIASSYQNQNYYLRGLESSKTWYQDDTNQIIQRVVTDQFWDQSGKDATQQPARTGSYFPADGETDTYFYEMSGAGGVRTFVSRLFDASGNLTDYYDNGDASNPFDTSDKFNYHVDYAHPATTITVPSGITIRQGVGTSQTAPLLAKRTVGTFDPGGKPKTVTDMVVNGKDPATGTIRTEASASSLVNATWTFTYDAYGNVKTATSPPPGGTSTNRNLQYTYDTTTQTYPTTTAETDTDAPYSSTATYDLRFGLPLNVTDVAGAQQQFCYDNYGRTTKVFAPSDLASGFVSCTGTSTPTIAVSYSEAPHTSGTSFAETLPAWAMATHLSNVPGEGSAPGATYTAQSLHTVNFVDGLVRSIQTKKDITHDDGTGTKALGMSVGGPTTFDARGRVYQQGQPIFVPGTTGDTSFVAVAMNNQTQYAYDVLGRLRQEQHPDNGTQATTTISYQLGFSPVDGREYILKMTADPLYGQNPYVHYRAEYRTVHDYVRLVAQTNIINNAYVNVFTSYAYDPLGRVIDVTDANENETFVEWDTAGNLVAVTSPDAGRHEWRYCLGGYVCAEQSANMIAVGPTSLIKNTYSRDRLATTTYPNSSTNATVTYTYGAATQKGSATTRVGYKANRVTQRTDEAGTFAYDYDGLGDVVTETATLKNQIAGGNYQAYTTNYTWDSFGRLIDVTIPGTTSVGTPAETIRYGYDAGGAVASAFGKVGTNTPIPYVQHVGYDEFGSRVFIKYGNQATSSYSYYSDTRRLANTSLTAGQPATLTQSQSYNYDLVGNLTSRQQELPLDTVATDVVPVGGVSYQYFLYDPLNQLTHTDMYDHLKITQDDSASVDLYYDPIGNIVEKDQTDGGIMYDSSGNYIGSYSGLLTYSVYPNYGGTTYNPSPHAASSVDKNGFAGFSTANLSYDHDGNLTSSVTSGSGKFITWTDTDRVRYVCNGTSTTCAPATAPHVTAALYAADGTRTHNKVTQGTSTTETVYVNQYLTVRNGTLPTKHVYLADARIASKVDSSATVNNTYWYHSDNVQSTQYVTTANGALAQHLRYYPGGEIWREQNSSAMLTPVAHATTFSAKELDASGYYYFGSRYYDPTVQTWLSPDPILSRYMKGAPNGGVFFPGNLELYTYSYNNPVTVRDADGNAPTKPVAAPGTGAPPPAPKLHSPHSQLENGGGAGGAGGVGGGMDAGGHDGASGGEPTGSHGVGLSGRDVLKGAKDAVGGVNKVRGAVEPRAGYLSPTPSRVGLGLSLASDVLEFYDADKRGDVAGKLGASVKVGLDLVGFIIGGMVSFAMGALGAQDGAMLGQPGGAFYKPADASSGAAPTAAQLNH
jgi:RHS repeat-associated protein